LWKEERKVNVIESEVEFPTRPSAQTAFSDHGTIEVAPVDTIPNHTVRDCLAWTHSWCAVVTSSQEELLKNLFPGIEDGVSDAIASIPIEVNQQEFISALRKLDFMKRNSHNWSIFFAQTISQFSFDVTVLFKLMNFEAQNPYVSHQKIQKVKHKSPLEETFIFTSNSEIVNWPISRFSSVSTWSIFSNFAAKSLMLLDPPPPRRDDWTGEERCLLPVAFGVADRTTETTTSSFSGTEYNKSHGLLRYFPNDFFEFFSMVG
jgi:hypothetical protein